ncbi:MAG: lysozyme-like domain containing protein [Ectothiorhodospiraceae bacterium]|nr:lysozyme-like domain containing protein [Ectothiorhodospiraceae bacterium]
MREPGRASADARRRLALVLLLLMAVTLLAGCASRPPDRVGNICEIFSQNPRWYDYARESEERWGTPIATQMAFVHQESTFQRRARPPRTRLLGFIPWRRPSTAYGYAQAQNPVWGEYMDDEGTLFARRTHMKYALDFIGWYNHRTHQRLGISKQNPEHLYYAYHEGHTGYRRGNWRSNAVLQRSAGRVSSHASRYSQQLPACERDLRCRRFWQVGPFCDA